VADILDLVQQRAQVGLVVADLVLVLLMVEELQVLQA
jgi:hypothetical protein